jgi:hypothetical protein
VCTIMIGGVRGSGTTPLTITVTGTATACDRVEVQILCGERELPPLSATVGAGGLWSVEFRNASEFGCGCGGPVEVRALCLDPFNPACSDRRTFNVLECDEAECPSITRVAVTMGDCEVDPSDGMTRRRVTFTPTIAGPAPAAHNWHFGDGSSTGITAGPPGPISHLYSTVPSARPRLQIVGPGRCPIVNHDVDLREFATFTPCEPVCPRITRIDVGIGDCETSPDGRRRRQVTFTPHLSGPAPTSHTWTWGDGTPAVLAAGAPTTQVHRYAAAPTSPPRLHILGPTDCPESTREVPLAEFATFTPCEPSLCPEITDIRVVIGECETATDGRRKRRVTFEPRLSGPAPTAWEFLYGDGATEFLAGAPPPSISHLYVDVPMTPPRLAIVGPPPCGRTEREVPLSELAALAMGCECPTIAISAPTIGDCNAGTRPVTFEATVTGPRPASFAWDFGDGTPSLPTATPSSGPHAYTVPSDRDTSFTVTVTASGPGDCVTRVSREISLGPCPPKQRESRPFVCGLMTYIIAALLGILFGLLILVLAFPLCFRLPVPPVLWGVVAGVAAAVGITIAISYILCATRTCPCLSGCDWLQILWMAFLTAVLIALYLGSCCGVPWWVVVIILAVITIALFLVWVLQCRPSPCDVLVAASVALISGAGLAFAYLGIVPIIRACGRTWVPIVSASAAALLAILGAACYAARRP